MPLIPTVDRCVCIHKACALYATLVQLCLAVTLHVLSHTQSRSQRCLTAGKRQLERRLFASTKASHTETDACMVQFRKSGEPFITHPVEVTRILAELKMDPESLIAGLLHDTVEDTENVKFEEIEVMQLSRLLIMHASLSGISILMQGG